MDFCTVHNGHHKKIISNEKSINSKALVQCSKSIIINAPVRKVWDTLTNINSWADWNPEIAYARTNDLLTEGATFDWKTGGSKIRSVLHTVVPYQYFGWTGKALGASAIHNWTLKGTGDKTTVTVEESMDGLIVALFSKAVNKSLEKGMQQWLDLLKVASEKQ